MLSIGKLATGQAKYYLDQAEVRVDAVGSIADGIEDYYLDGGEARGRWLGVGARELGLAGAVDGVELRRVLDGLDPLTGASLRTSRSPVRVSGFDLTFSAPKSVSVVYAIGEPEIQDAVRRAHDRAVVEAVGYLERSAARVRRGAGGASVERAAGLVAAAFRHRTSRLGDPQLHTHVLVANLARGPDGRWSALDARQIYSHARAASLLYQAVLRGELTRTLGVEWRPVRQGIAEIAGVPAEVLKAFSRRRAEIEAALEQRGTHGPRAAEAAVLATRQRKQSKSVAAELAPEWRRRAAALDFSSGELERVLGRGRSRGLDARVWDAIELALTAPEGLTQRHSTFTRRDVIQTICERLPAGATVDARMLEAAADRLLASDRVVALIPRDGSLVLRRRDGRLMPVIREELRYSTPELLALEQRLIERVIASRATGVAQVGVDGVEHTLMARPALTPEQREMVRALCLRGDGVAVVAGKAGTGKTYALDAARAAWQDAGYPVLGVAVARRAARELEDGAGIASTSVAALLRDLAVRGGVLPRHVVLVVDEAGMVPTRQLATLVHHVERADGKLVLIGDHRQLPELEAGGAFRGLVQRGLAIELRDNQRQVHAWERTALDHLRDGRAEAALALYQANDRVVVERDTSSTRARLVRDWWQAGDREGAVMVAHRRADVAALNEAARELLRASGDLRGPELRLPGGNFAVGDSIVVRRNDVSLGVNNGDRGRVVAVDDERRRLALNVRGRHVWLSDRFLFAATERGDPTLVHGYAITGHIAQGLTARQTFVLMSEGVSREWGYVALSRGTEANRLYVPERTADAREEFAPADALCHGALDRLVAALSTSVGDTLAIDQGQQVPKRGDVVAGVRDAAEAHRVAVDRRRALEMSRARWLPHRRARLADARDLEASTLHLLQELRGREAEQLHSARPFVIKHPELEQRAEERRERIMEIRRTRDRDSGIER